MMATYQGQHPDQKEYTNNSVAPTDNPPYQLIQSVEGTNSKSKSTITPSNGDDVIVDHLREANDQLNQNEPVGHDQNRELAAVGNKGGDHEIIISRQSLPNPDNGAKVNNTADRHESAESCCTSVINYVSEHKYELICGVCIVVAIALFIAFLIPAIVIPFKLPQSGKVNTTSLIKPHFFPFGGFDYYCILVEEISEFSNGKVTLSSSGGVSKKVTLAIAEELVTTIQQYSITNTTLSTGLIGRFEFDGFVINDFNLEIDVETDTGGILNLTQLRIDKHGKAHTIKTENITLANESAKNFNYSTNESGFYELYVRGYEGITGTLSGRASYSSCRSNQSYPHNCSIAFQGDTKKCEVNVSTTTSGYILLILDEHEYDETIFSITETGTIRLKDKDNTALKSVMIIITIICGLITVVTILVWLFQIWNRIYMWLQHNIETPDTSSALISPNPANERTPLI